MPARIEQQPLSRPVTTKISEQDYQNLIAQVEKQEVNQTTLVRHAIRQYLCQRSQNSESPSDLKEVPGDLLDQFI